MEIERPQENKNEQLEKDIARIEHFLNDFSYNYEPEIFVQREVRKQWEISDNPEDKAKLERYKNSMFRIGNIQAVSNAIEFFAITYFSDTELGKKYLAISDKIIENTHRAGAPKGELMPIEIVQTAKITLINLKADLEALK